jgi:hypothetical protein
LVGPNLLDAESRETTRGFHRRDAEDAEEEKFDAGMVDAEPSSFGIEKAEGAAI